MNCCANIDLNPDIENTTFDGLKYLISIVGPTGVGKSALAVHLAGLLRTQVISADSRQVFKGMDIGTAKITSAEMGSIPHHLIDVVNPDEPMSAGIFAKLANKVIASIFEKQFTALMVGGSGLYLQAVWNGFDEMPNVPQVIRDQVSIDLKEKGLEVLVKELMLGDPDFFGEIDLKNPRRVQRAIEILRATGKPISFYQRKNSEEANPATAISGLRRMSKNIAEYESIKIGLTLDRPVLYDKLNHRVDRMMEEGLFEEVKSLLSTYGSATLAFQTVGYKELIAHLEGENTIETAIELIKRNTRRFAKRQYTWFRRYDDVAWFEADDWAEIERYIFDRIGVD